MRIWGIPSGFDMETKKKKKRKQKKRGRKEGKTEKRKKGREKKKKEKKRKKKKGRKKKEEKKEQSGRQEGRRGGCTFHIDCPATVGEDSRQSGRILMPTEMDGPPGGQLYGRTGGQMSK